VRSVHAGVVAPDFEATTLNGKPFKLSDLRGKLVFLDFWATWCAPCVAELPNVKKIHEKFAARGLTVVSISFDRDAETARKFAADKQMNWAQVWAEKADKGPIADLYGVGGIPATFLIGPDGKVVERDLRGEELVEAVEREAKKLRTAKGESQTQPVEMVAQAASPAAPATQAPPSTRPADAPEARAVLEATVARYRSLKSYSDSFRYEARLVHKDEAEPQLGYLEGTLLFESPKRLVSKSDTFQVYYDGQRLTRYMPAARQYTVDEGAEALQSLRLGESALPGQAGLGVHPLVSLLVNRELPIDQALPVSAVTGVAPETRNGRAGRRLSGYLRLPMLPDGREVPFTAFISDQTQLLEEVRIDLTDVARAAAAEEADEAEASEVKLAEVILTFSDVELDAEVAATAFAFNPAGARKVQAFGSMPERFASPLDLLGQPAPGLAGPTLEGPAFDLAGERGRPAVVAFWGTWAPEAPRLLADLQQLVASQVERPVVIAGVNRNGAEGESAVRRRLADAGARFCQVVDRTGELAEAWHVAALPAVFLVDAQGIIAEAHLTWSETTRQTAAEQLARLLNSEPLYTREELTIRRSEAGDFDQSGGLLVRASDHEVAGERLEVAQAQELNGSRWNMSEQDVDGDGQPELILPDWGGGLSLVKPATGEVRRVQLRSLGNVSVQSLRGVMIDGEVCWLCAAAQYRAVPGAGGRQHALVRLYSPHGEILWTFSPQLPENTSSTACATAGDLDGDGALEYAIGLSTYVQEASGEHSYSMEDMRGRLIVLDQQSELVAQRDLPGSIDLLYVPLTPAGQPVPLLCLSGGQLERYMLRPGSPGEKELSK
jgi:peroxiredoxin